MIPERAEPDSLFCIGPDREIPSAADPSDVNVAIGHSILGKKTQAHLEFRPK
jgi:hypothetical protein